MSTASEHPAALADMQEKVERLAKARRDAATASANMSAIREESEARFAEIYAPGIAAEAAAKAEVNSAEQSLRGHAIAFHAVTGEAKPVAGVSIVMVTKYAVDEEAGLAWAQQTGMALTPAKLDVKAAQKIASVTPLPFVTITEEPSVRIASDLDKAVAEVAA